MPRCEVRDAEMRDAEMRDAEMRGATSRQGKQIVCFVEVREGGRGVLALDSNSNFQGPFSLSFLSLLPRVQSLCLH